MTAATPPRPTALSNQAVSGVGAQLTANIVKFGARFGIGIGLARLLPPEDFGVIGLAFIATGLASTMAELGLGPALIQRAEITDRHVRVSLTFSLLTSVLAAVALAGSADYVASLLNDARVGPVLQIMAISFAFTGFRTTSAALLTRRLAFRTSVKIEIVASAIGYGVVAIAAAAAGHGYWSLVWAAVTQSILASVLSYGAVRHPLRPLVAKEELRDLSSFSVAMSLSSTVNFLARQADYLIVGRVLGPASLGLYTRAYMFVELPHALVGAGLSKVLFPAASRVQGDLARFRRALTSALTLSTSFALPSALAISVLADELVFVLYGQQWEGVVPVLQVLALFGVWRMTFNVAAAFVRASGRADLMLIANAAYLVLVLVGALLGVRLAGLVGAAWAVGLALLVCWILVLQFVCSAAGITRAALLSSLLAAAGPGLGSGVLVLATAAMLRLVDSPAVVVLGLSGTVAILSTSAAVYSQVIRLADPSMLPLVVRVEAVKGRVLRSAPTRHRTNQRSSGERHANATKNGG